MLAKDRRERYSSIEEVSDQLAPYAAPTTSAYRTTQLGAAERPRSAAPVAGARGLTTRTSQTPLSWDRNDKPSGSRKGWAIGAVVLALAVVGAAAAYVYQNRSGDDLGPGVAKPQPEQRPDRAPSPAAASDGEPVERDIPRGVLPETAPAPAPATEVAPQDPKAASAPPEQPKAPAAPAPAAAVKAAQPPSAPAPSAKPAPAPPAQTPSVRGAPPRGQISDFGGRR
jgi:hypothetical protein